MSALTIGRRSLRWQLLAVAMACLTACGGGGGGGANPSTPPVLSNLKYSPSDTAQTAGGTFSVQGTLDFSDAGGDLANLTVVVLDASGKQLSSTSTEVQGVSGKTSGTIQGSVTIPTGNVGTFTFDVSATDAAGSVSNVLSGSFRIVAASNLAAIVTPTGETWQTLIAAGGYLYWSEVGDKPVNRVPLAGGGVEGLGPRVRNPTSAAFAGSDLIWLDARSDNGASCLRPGDDRIVRVLFRTASSGATQNLGTDYACGPQFTSIDLLVAGGSAFWVTSTDTTYAIRATALAGGTTTTLVTTSDAIVALASANGTIYWMENSPGSPQAAIRSVATGGGSVATIASGFASNTNSFAVDATSVYYATAGASFNSDNVVAQPLAGGPAVTLATALMTPMKLATDGHVVVWTDSIGAPPIITSHINAVPVGGGAVTALATFSAFPGDLLITAGSAVWSSATPDAISSVPLAGGPTTTLYQGSDAPRGLFLDASSRICWTNGNQVGLADGFDRIARLTSTTTGETLAGGISYDAPILFVTATDVLVADNYRVKRIPLSGGVIDTVAVEADRSPIESLASDGTTVYWDVGAAAHAAPVSVGAITVLAPSPTGFDLGGQMRLAANGNLYWWGTDNTNYEVLSVPAAGGALTVLAQGLPRLSALAVDATSVYVRSADISTGGIFAVPFAGGPTVVIADSAGYPNPSLGVFDLEVDGSYLYWTEGGQIARVPVAGGDPYPVVDFVPTMSMYELPVMAFDATNVYWTEPLLQDIRKAAKP
jgi:hypothetical protein